MAPSQRAHERHRYDERQPAGSGPAEPPAAGTSASRRTRAAAATLLVGFAVVVAIADAQAADAGRDGPPVEQPSRVHAQ